MKVFASCSCQLSLLVSPFWFLPWRTVICYLSSLYDIFCLIMMCCIFSTFWGESFQFNFVVLLWHCRVDSSQFSFSSTPALFLPWSASLSLKAPFACHPVGLWSHPVLPTLPLVCSVYLREGTCHISKFFFFFSGFWPIRWLPLAVNFQYDLAWWCLLASTFPASLSRPGVRRKLPHFSAYLRDQDVDSLASAPWPLRRWLDASEDLWGGGLWARWLLSSHGPQRLSSVAWTEFSENLPPYRGILLVKFLINHRLLRLHTACRGGGG